MLKTSVQQGRRRVETGGVPQRYVEDFDELRTPLAGVFSILLEQWLLLAQPLDLTLQFLDFIL